MREQSYVSPLSTRYASPEMQYLFSEEKKIRTWRRLWVALARAEKAQGLDISDEQIRQLEQYADDINYDDARKREKEIRHDVMSHIYAYGLQCPEASGIIHLGATSCYVGDNTDLLIMREALVLVRSRLLGVISRLARFAEQYAAVPCLAYTHIQPAQLTTVGKRAVLWIHELVMDLEELDHRLNHIAFLGSKGTTGTQASFMELFEGDNAKIDAVEKQIAAEMGFDRIVPVSGQTYSRKTDYQVLSTLSGIAQSASKFAYDMRLLASFKEIEEPFESSQVGSSAMPYKRNPMRCERIDALARYVMIDALNPAVTSSCQFFERTLDDSANKRLSVPEAFLATDAILRIMQNVCEGMVVYENVIRRRVMEELPFMATENILMDAVKRGGNRQELHEKLRRHTQDAARLVKEDGKKNDLLDRIANDPAFAIDGSELEKILRPELYTGRSEEQVRSYIRETVEPLTARYDVSPEISSGINL